MSIKDIDITKNIKIIEWLKTELLNGIAKLFSAFSNSAEESKDLLSSCISNIIIISYLLGKRLGLDFSDIDSDIREKLKTGVEENHEIEKRYGELTLMLSYIQKERQ